jgi:chemotaxis protein MotB
MKKILLISLLTAIAMMSCVSSGTYDDMVRQRDSVQVSNDSLSTIMHDYEDQIASLKKQRDALEKELMALQTEHANLLATYTQMKSSSSTETQALLARIEKLQRDLAEKGLRLNTINGKLKAREDKMNALRDMLNKALLGFKDSGLSVHIKDGKVYVSLSNQLLFKVGKTNINKEGQNALLELSQVLNAQKDINVLVEGHTDNQAVRGGGRYADNWDLSVLRATEVVRYLTIDGKVDPKRIIASGRSEYIPLEEGESDEARAKNRRTEIILVPKLDLLYEIIEK